MYHGHVSVKEECECVYYQKEQGMHLAYKLKRNHLMPLESSPEQKESNKEVPSFPQQKGSATAPPPSSPE
jgi:hypothetical protein